jgi:hypothetical protein
VRFFCDFSRLDAHWRVRSIFMALSPLDNSCGERRVCLLLVNALLFILCPLAPLSSHLGAAISTESRKYSSHLSDSLEATALKHVRNPSLLERII